MKPPTCSRCKAVYSLGIRENEGGGRRGPRGDYGKHPLLLRCGHTFCRPCLRKCETSEEDIQCPTCQKMTKQGPKGVSPDIYTVGLMWTRRLELEHQSNKISVGDRTRGKKSPAASGDGGKPVPRCMECQQVASCQCLKCESVMCRACFDTVHSKSFSLKKHQAVPLRPQDGLPPEDRLVIMPERETRSRYCPSHQQCQIEYFCNQDQLPICSRCVIMGDHKGHDVQTMEDKNKESLSEMEPAMVEVQETIWRLEKAEQVVKGAMPHSQVDSSKVVEEVRLHFLELHSLLQAREEQLVEDIREAAVNTTKPFHDTVAFLQNEKTRMNMDLIEAGQAMQGSVHTLVDADLILERLRKAKDVPCMATVDREALAHPLTFSSDTTLRDAIGSYGSVLSRNSTQMFTLTVPSTDSPKPPPQELPAVILPGPPPPTEVSDENDSAADSASVIVEEEREETGSMAGDVIPEQPRITEPALDRPGSRLVAGHQEKIRVTHIRTPCQFYVQLVSGRGELETMQRYINNHCRSLAHQGKQEAPRCLDPGTVVLAQFSHDKNWYRAVITSVMEPDKGGEDRGGGTFEVFFMDYGNSERVFHSKLRQMQPKFESHPAFAYECKLHDLLPVNKARGWTEESVNVMLDMTSSGIINMKVLGEGLGALSVDLIKPETLKQCVDDQQVSLRETLVFLHLAVSTTFIPQRTPVGRAKHDYISLGRQQDGEVLYVAVTHVETPYHFFVQGCEPTNCAYLEQQSRAMQDTYQGDNGQLYTLFCPREGLICVAKYDKDERWYRARVTGLPGAGKVQVQFVDYGNTETVDRSHVRKMVQNYIKFPEQAMECSLVDVEPRHNGQWSEEALQWFKMTAELQYAQLRVVGHCDKPNKLSGVLYLISQDNQQCCVNSEMVQRGLANSTGTWSQGASFEGITLRPESAVMSSSSSSAASSPSSRHTSPGLSNRTTPTLRRSPRPQATTPPRPQGTNKLLRSSPRTGTGAGGKGSTASTPSPSPTKKGITLRNLHKGAPDPAEKERDDAAAAAAAAAMMKSVGVEVVISGYRSPAHFFIQLQEKQKELLDLMMELAASETAAAQDRAWTVGEFCVAKYSKDDSWYRAKISNVMQDTATYQVSLMDYGYVDTVPASRLHPLQKAHADKECFSQRCHLANLAPAGSMDRTHWTATAVDFMADEIRAKRLFLKLEGDRTEDMGLPVDILVEELIPETALDPLRHEYISLVSLLQERGLAFPATTPSTQGPSEPPASSQPTAQQPEPLPGSEPFHSSLTASLADSAFADADTTGVEGAEGEGAIPRAPSGVEEVVLEVIVQPDCDVLPHPPPPSTTLTVIPVHVDSHGVIYAHDSQTEEECTAFMDVVDQYAKTQPPHGRLEVKVGQMCVAFYPPDQAWYRARLLEVGQSTVKVKYIDYGNTHRLDRSLLRMILPELCDKHQVAYEFKLHNLKPDTVDGSWPPTFLEYMEKQLVNNKCTALIKTARDQVPVGVELVHGEGDRMGTTLLQMGVVRKDNDMEDFYQRTADISNILQHSNPYFPLRPGDVGTVFTGVVTHMELPNLVYIQRCAAPDHSLPEDLMKFAQLMEDLNNDNQSQHAPLQELPSAGEVCCACYSQDQRWYRALVAKTFPHDHSALVYYVDYGNSEVVTLDRLRCLPAQFQDMPAQAVRAFLNLDLPAGAARWTLAMYHAMGEAVYLRRHVVLIKFADPLTVELFSEDEHQYEAAILSYQKLVHEGVVTVPQPLIVTDVGEGDNVIVESCTEEELEQDSEKEPEQEREKEPEQEQEKEPEQEQEKELEQEKEPEQEHDKEPEQEQEKEPEPEQGKEPEQEQEKEPEQEQEKEQEQPEQEKELEQEQEKEPEQEKEQEQEEKEEEGKERSARSSDSELD